jgi:hypothetical protein
MELKEASESLKVPVRVLERMARDGLISNPLDEASIRAVSLLGHVWRERWFAGAVMRGIKSRKERILLVLFPDYNKIDRYVLNTYLNDPDGKNIAVEILKYRVRKAFLVNVDEKRIFKIRQVAYDIKRGKLKLKLGHLSLNYGDILGVSEATYRER